LDFGLWTDVLTGLAQAAGADGAALIYQSLADGSGSSVIVGIDPAARPLYFGEFARKNPLQIAETLKEQLAAFRPAIRHDEQFLSKAEFERTDFYQGIFRPFDMHSVLTIGLGIQGVNHAGVNLVRSRRRPQFETAAFQAMAHWHGALIRAFDVGMALSPVNSARDDLAAALDTLADAILLVEADGRVAHTNEPARRLLATERGVALVGGRLRARDSDQIRLLEGLIASAIEGESHQGGAMALTVGSGQPPLSLTVTPLGPRRSSSFETPPLAMV
jgi:PAS domain-containing protein